MIVRSVTSRLVLFYCLFLAILGGVFLAFTIWSFQFYTRQTIADGLIDRTQEIWNTAQSLLDQPAKLADTIERRFAPEIQDRVIRIRVGDRILYRSGRPADGSFSVAQIPFPPPSENPRSEFGTLLLYTERFDSPVGTVTIDNGQSYLPALQVEKKMAMSMFVGLPILLILAALTGYVLMRSALRPVEVMINAAEAYTFNDRHNRLPLVGTEPRIEALGLALNRMLDRLDHAYEHVSRFSADAAHELRTPLTIIRGELELILAGERLPGDFSRPIGNAMEEMTRLSGIVEGLITLSRMESLWGKRYHTIVDLTALAVETIDQMKLLAEEKNIRLDCSGELPVLVAGDRDRLKQVLVNLIDNAIKYTPAKGRVRLATDIQQDKAVVTVEDSGIGIAPDEREHIFEQFYRVSTDRGEEGAGLGLAIVRSICHAHGGSITVRSSAGAGSTFTVELPLLPVGLDIPSEPQQDELAAAKLAAANRVDHQNG